MEESHADNFLRFPREELADELWQLSGSLVESPQCSASLRIRQLVSPFEHRYLCSRSPAQ